MGGPVQAGSSGLALAIGRDGAGRFREVRAHCRRVAPGQNETSPFILLGTTGTEEIGRSSALVAWSGWSRSASCPAKRMAENAPPGKAAKAS